jgi:Transcriptional regulator
MAKPGTTRDTLLQVAFDLIWNNSYGSVSVGDICERAGVNKGSFYHFFESKSELAVTAYQEHWRESRPKFDAIFSSQLPPLERIHNWCEFVYEGQKAKREKYGHICGCPYASVGSEIATQDERIRAKTEEILDCGRKYLESAIAEAARLGQITEKDPAKLALRVQSVFQGMLIEAKVQNDLEILRDLEPTVMRLIGAKESEIATA